MSTNCYENGNNDLENNGEATATSDDKDSAAGDGKYSAASYSIVDLRLADALLRSIPDFPMSSQRIVYSINTIGFVEFAILVGSVVPQLAQAVEAWRRLENGNNDDITPE